MKTYRKELTFNTKTRRAFINITPQVEAALAESGIREGLVLDKAFPDRAEFRHGEGNSSAHLKASAVGSGATVIVKDGGLLLGTWQGIYFCEFDGPRSRKVYVKIM